MQPNVELKDGETVGTRESAGFTVALSERGTFLDTPICLLTRLT